MNPHAALEQWSEWAWPLVAGHLVEGAVFAAIAFGAAAALGRRAPGARYAILLLASAKIALPAFALAGVAAWAGLDVSPRLAEVAGLTRGPALDVVAIARLAPSDVFAVPTPARDGAHDERFCLLTIVWLAGALFVAATWLRRRAAVERDVRAGRRVAAGREVEALERAQLRVGRVGRAGRIARTGLVVSARIAQPGVVGVFRPRIALPEGIAERLGDDELEAVLVHELVHVRRRDNLVATLEMWLCCVFWFYPVVWMLDRRMLAERERACDDAVLALAADRRAYAAGLLKVCRFCLDGRVAGVSAAAGAGIARRIDEILAFDGSPRGAAPRRVAVASVAAGLALSLLSGLVAAAEIGPRLERAPERDVRVEELPGSPVRILEARSRVLEVDGEEAIGPPAVLLENRSGDRVVHVRIAFGAPPRFLDEVGFDVAIAPGATARITPDWREWLNQAPAGSADRLVARVAGVVYESGATWGERELEARDAASFPVRFENVAGAPLEVAGAVARAATGPGDAMQPTVLLRNATGDRITAVKLRFKSDAPGHAVTAFEVSIEPRATHVFARDLNLDGSPNRVSVQVVGVEFEDGTVWGAFDTRILSAWQFVPVPHERRLP